MKWNDKKPYIYAMLAGFGALALGILFFFTIYRFNGFSTGIQTLINILSPFVYGAAIAYVLRPVCNFLNGLFSKHLPKSMKKSAGGLAVTFSILFGVGVVVVLFILIIPQLLDSVLSLIRMAPDRIDAAVAWAQKMLTDQPELQKQLTDFYASVSDSLDNWVKNTALPYLTGLLGTFGSSLMRFFGGISDLFIGIIVAIYILAARHKFARQGRLVLYSVVRRDWADVIHEEFAYADDVFQGFISGKLLDSLIIGLICYVFCVIARIPSSILIAVVVGVTNIIPFFGPFIGAIPSILLILIVDPIRAIWFTVFVIILQQFDGNILGPKILGHSTGLSSFWVMFAILLFGGIWGFPGMILGVPFFAVIYDVLTKLIFRGLHRNHCDDMLESYNRRFGSQPEPTKETASAEVSSAAPGNDAPGEKDNA